MQMLKNLFTYINNMQSPSKHIIPLFEGFCRKNQMDGKEIEAMISGHPVKLKIATSDNTKEKGMMGSNEPEDDGGMLFVYDEPDVLNFWMKDIDFPLDILFFDDKMELINHLNMEPGTGVEDKDLPRYSSDGPARFAVELKSGWSNKIKDDCKLKF